MYFGKLAFLIFCKLWLRVKKKTLSCVISVHELLKTASWCFWFLCSTNKMESNNKILILRFIIGKIKKKKTKITLRILFVFEKNFRDHFY